MLHAPVGPGAFPPDEQLEVITLATSKTSEHECVASQWSLDDLATVLVQGQLQLRRCSGKDFQQEVVVPTATAAFHHDAGAGIGMLLQQR